ncbi:phage holin family protein [Levilactobacillus tujiorum]|uniref:Phage holin family protein n=1 Tax=Levilactobacillus tujiorum TaxID=2912243 RepID=A0ABX1L8L3_9LACO|nr:phage holin family protein [Levilactobacillus tujiorum]MCH5464463.1 phage holin family protein [Levilactobacillus tujiorum]NLR11483.1 phage holin family protein [Lactobacillus sp. HBUAS51387]NLR29435.1 phage holin family protein [Levilactobacillus tujiorum]
MRFWPRILVNAVIFLALAGFFQSSLAGGLQNAFYVSGVGIALLASFVLALLNAVVKPILFVLSLPITVLTLGLFSVVINAAMLELTSWFVGSNFAFSSFGITMMVAIIMSIFNAIISDHFATN